MKHLLAQGFAKVFLSHTPALKRKDVREPLVLRQRAACPLPEHCLERESILMMLSLAVFQDHPDHQEQGLPVGS